jgi:hypothetical protein
MKRILAITVLVSVLGLNVAAAATPDANDPHWGCYDPLPGHATDAEKEAFIAAMAPTAQAAEQRGGPPAAGLLAMSALESGFSWTRTAIFANNLFGWKFTGAAAVEGRSEWTLACQPASDPNNRYIVFRDGADSITFVADRLASMERYAPVTRQYHIDRAGGVPVDSAVARWVRGIAAAGYNPFPTYPTQVLSLANNYLHPGPTPSAEFALYRFSTVLPNTPAAAAIPASAAPAPSPGPVTPNSASAQAAAAALGGALQRSRYMSDHCDPTVINDWPDYQGRNVTRCQYSVTSGGKTLSALVYLLNPPEENIVARIEGACQAIGLGDHPGCGRGLARMIVAQNGGQFPVAGFVIERKEDAGGQGADPVYLEFRDGCTVETMDHLNFTDRPLTVDAMEHAARAPVASTRRIGRIANATRADYKRAGGSLSVGTGPADDKQNRWLQAIRENELQAQDTGNDALLRGVAMGMRDQLSRD